MDKKGKEVVWGKASGYIVWVGHEGDARP